MLWVYDSYNYFFSYSAGIDFGRQILMTKVDPRTVRVKLIPQTAEVQICQYFLIYSSWTVSSYEENNYE